MKQYKRIFLIILTIFTFAIYFSILTNNTVSAIITTEKIEIDLEFTDQNNNSLTINNKDDLLNNLYDKAIQTDGTPPPLWPIEKVFTVSIRLRSTVGEIPLSGYLFDMIIPEFMKEENIIIENMLPIYEGFPEYGLVFSLSSNRIDNETYRFLGPRNTAYTENNYTLEESAITIINFSYIIKPEEINDVPETFSITPFLTAVSDFTFNESGEEKSYNLSDIYINNLTLGDPNAEPNAKLSGATIQGQNDTYDVSSFDTLNEASIELSYQDSLNELEITPLYEKSSGVSSEIMFYNSSGSEKGANDDFITGDYIEIITVDDTDATVTETYIININVTDASTDNNIEFKYVINTTPSGQKDTVPIVGEKHVLEVDFNTTEVTIYGTPANPLANIIDPTPTGSESFIKQTLNVGDNQIGPFTVRAENGDEEDHYVTVKRKAGSNNTDLSMRYEWNDGVGHSKVIDLISGTQTIELDSKTNYAGFILTFGHTNQKVTYSIGNGETKTYLQSLTNPINIFNESGVFGNNYNLDITVIAEDGETTENYNIIFKVLPSNDTSLNSESVAVKEQNRDVTRVNNLEYVLFDPFNESGNNYIDLFIKPHSHQEIKFKDVSYSPNEISYRLYESDLPNRINEFQFTVRAQDQSTEQTYTIKIIRKSNEANIEQMVFRSINTSNIYAEFTKGDFIQDPHNSNMYTFKFAHSDIAVLNQLQLNVTSSDGSTIALGSNNTYNVPLDFTSQSNFDGKVVTTVFTVISENGEVQKTYTINIEKEAASKDVSLDWIKIAELPFADYNNNMENPTFGKYIITPEDSTITSKLAYVEVKTAENSLAKVTINGQSGKSYNLNLERPHLTTLVIKVTAEDERVTNTITIPIYYGTDETDLTSITIDGTDYVFNKDETNVEIEVPYSFQENTLVKATANSGHTQIMIDGLVRSEAPIAIGSKTSIRVQARSEIGTLGEIYIITLKRKAPQIENVLKDLKVFKGDNSEYLINFTPGVNEYNVRVDDIANLWPVRIEASVEESHRSYINAKGQSTFKITSPLQSGQSTQIVITVYSEGGNRNDYIVNLLRANDVLEFEEVVINGNTYSVDDFTGNKLILSNVNYSTKNLNVKFKMIGGSNSTIESGLSFIGNNLEGIWDLTKTGASNPNIETFAIKSQAGNLSIPYTIEIIRENPLKIAELEELEILVNGENIFNITKPVSGFNSFYSLRVDRNISEVLVKASVKDGDRSIIRDFGESNLIESNKVYSKGFSLNEGTFRDIVVEVLAEDGITFKTHTIRIYRQNSNINIESIILDIDNVVIYTGSDFNAAIEALKNREILFTDKKLNITLKPEDINSKIFFNSAARSTPTGEGLVIGSFDLISGDGSITLRIESDIADNLVDGEYKISNKTFTYTKKAASNVARLDELEVIVDGVNLLEGIFDSENFVYGEAPTYIIVNRNFSQVNISGTAKENGNVIEGLGGRTLVNAGGLNTFIVKVQSESGTYSQEYIIHIYRNDNINTIDDIKVDNNEVSFDESFNSDLGSFVYSKDKINLEVLLTNANAKYFINGQMYNGTQKLVEVPLEYGDNNTIEIYAVSDFEYHVHNDSAIRGQLYTIKYKRIDPMTDTNISFEVTDGTNTLLDENNLVYTIELPDTSTLQKLFLNIELKDKQTLSTGFIEGSNEIVLNINEDGSIEQNVVFVVNAEDNVSREYNIRITKGIPLSDNIEIDEIKIIDNFNFEYPFNIEDISGLKVIDLGDVLFEVESLILNIKKADEKANLEILNPYSLEIGENIIEFVITSERGTSSQTYQVRINRGEADSNINLKEIRIVDPLNTLNNLVGLSNISERGVLFNPEDHENQNIYLDESYIGKQLSVTFEKLFKNQKITLSSNSITLSAGTNNSFIISVVAENGDSRTYNFTFHVLYETNDLVSLKLNDDLIDLENLLKYETKIENIVVVPTLEEKFGSYKIYVDNIEITSTTKQFKLNIGDVKILKIAVYSQVNTTTPIKTYELEVERIALSTNNKLNEIRFLDPLNHGVFLFGLEHRNPTQDIFSNDVVSYEIKLSLDYLHKFISIDVEKGDEFQKVTLNPISKTLTKGDNIFIVTVQAENSDQMVVPVITYTINIKVLNTENDLTNLLINGENILFREPIVEYETEEMVANIVPTLVDKNGSYIIKDINGNVIVSPYNLAFGDNEIIIEVLNEYGDVVNEYQVNIIRNKVSDTSFSEIKLNGSDNINYLNEFHKNIFEYEIQVPQNVSYVTLSANIHPTSTATGIGRYNIELDENITISFYVTAENGDVGDIYTIIVKRRSASTNNSLNELFIKDPINSGYLLGFETKNPNVIFDGKQTYTVTVNEDYLNEFIIIEFVKGHIAQTISGDANKQLYLTAKQNKFTINVAPEDPSGITSTYVVNVNIEYENNKLIELKLDNQVMDLNAADITLTTLKESVNIQTTLENQYGKVEVRDELGNLITSNNLDLDFGVNNYILNIYSETGNITETYSFNITREKHTDKEIINVTLNGDDGINYFKNFETLTKTYNVEVPLNVNAVTLNVTTSPMAVVTGNGTYNILLDETKEITFYVTAEDGSTTDTYTINVTKRSLSTNNKLGEIRFEDPLDQTTHIFGLPHRNPFEEFNPDITKYTINLGTNYVGQPIVLRYTLGDNNQTVNGIVQGETKILVRGNNSFNITVLPEDTINGDALVYLINIVVLNEENSLEEIEFGSDIVKPVDGEIYYLTEEESLMPNLVLENLDGDVLIKDNLGNIINLPLNLELGINDFVIEVYNEFDNMVETIELVIERVKSSDNKILSSTLTDSLGNNYLTFDENTLSYTINIPFDVGSVDLEVLTNSKAKVYIDNIQMTLNSYVLVAGILTYTEFYVEAENGDLSETYKLYITRDYNDENRLSELSIETNIERLYFDSLVEITEFKQQVNEEHEYIVFSYLANYGQSVILRDVNLLELNFSEQISLVNGLNQFTIEVKPEDPNGISHIINIEIELLNSYIELEELLVDGIDKLDLLEGNKIVLPTVDSTTSEITIKPVLPLNSQGSYTIDGEYIEELTVVLNQGLNTITVVLTSQDGSSEVTYLVEVEKLLEEENKLELLEVIDNLDNSLIEFDSETNEYNIVVNEDVDSININATPKTSKQTINGLDNPLFKIIHGVNPPIVVEVVAENGETFEYIVNVTKEFNNVYIDEILIDNVNEYVEGNNNYNLGKFEYSKETILVEPKLLNYSTYELVDGNDNPISNLVQLKVGVNTVKVLLSSENSETKEEVVFIIERLEDSNTEITDVTLIDIATNDNRIYFNPNTKHYSVAFPHTTENVRLQVTADGKQVLIDNVIAINKSKNIKLNANESTFVEFYALAKDGTKGDTYTIEIYKRAEDGNALSSDTTLSNVTIEVPIGLVEIGFRADKYEYEVLIPYKYEEIYIKGLPRDNGAHIPNEGAYKISKDDETVVRLRVIAEDGTVANQEYVFRIRREEPNKDTTLKHLSITDELGNVLELNQEFNSEIRSYSIKLENSDVNIVYVDALENHITQTIYNPVEVILSADLEGRYNTLITVSVEAENGDVGTYQVYILFDLDFDDVLGVKDISLIGDDDYEYFGLEFKNNIYEYTVENIPYYVEETRLIIQTLGNGQVQFFNESNELIDNNNLTFNNNEAIYRFKIISGNGRESEMYRVAVTRLEADSNTNLSSIEVNGQKIKDFKPDVYEYTYIHPLQFESYVEVRGITESDKSIVRGNNVYELFEGQTRTVELVVIAENGSTDTYFVHVKYVSSNALLGGLTVDQLIGTKEHIQSLVVLNDLDLNYTVIIEREVDSIRLNAAAKDLGGASVTGSGLYTIGKDLMERTFEIRVTSGDGSEELNYYITIVRDNSLSSLKEIASLAINGEQVNNNDDPFIYSYNLANGSNTVRLNAVANSNAKLKINGQTFDSNTAEIELTDVNESQVVTVSVMAEDGTIQNYTVILNKEQAPNLMLTILLILSIILWVITAMVFIWKKIGKNDSKKNKNELLF